MKSHCVPNQMNATEQYFPVVLFIMFYKVDLTCVQCTNNGSKNVLGLAKRHSNFRHDVTHPIDSVYKHDTCGRIKICISVEK